MITQNTKSLYNDFPPKQNPTTKVHNENLWKFIGRETHSGKNKKIAKNIRYKTYSAT